MLWKVYQQQIQKPHYHRLHCLVGAGVQKLSSQCPRTPVESFLESVKTSYETSTNKSRIIRKNIAQ